MALPILYDFYAEWCAPCKAMAPSMETLEKTFAGQIEVRKINIDEDTDLATQYGIRSIPTLVLVSGENEIARVVGAKPLAVLEMTIRGALVVPTANSTVDSGSGSV